MWLCCLIAVFEHSCVKLRFYIGVHKLCDITQKCVDTSGRLYCRSSPSGQCIYLTDSYPLMLVGQWHSFSAAGFLLCAGICLLACLLPSLNCLQDSFALSAGDMGQCDVGHRIGGYFHAGLPPSCKAAFPFASSLSLSQL